MARNERFVTYCDDRASRFVQNEISGKDGAFQNDPCRTARTGGRTTSVIDTTIATGERRRPGVGGRDLLA